MDKIKKLASKHAQKLRFGVVGAANTVLDFALLFLFVSFGFNSVVANYFSTGIAFIVSFFVNKSYTFKSKGGNVKKQFTLFILVTMVGLWIIQPILIYIVTNLLTGVSLSDNVILFIAKLIATVGSLVWNYTFYSRLVFKTKEK